MRTFNGNAVRDTNAGKISYYGFRHPAVELSFGKYMLGHQKCADGTMREANNWWGGWSENVSIDSMVRHVEDLCAIHAGYTVVKIRNEQSETTVYLQEGQTINVSDKEEVIYVTKEDCYNAIRFNCGSGLLEHLKNK